MEAETSYVQYLFWFGIIALFLYGYILHSLQRKHGETTNDMMMQMLNMHKEYSEQLDKFRKAEEMYAAKLESTANNAVAALAYAVEKGKSGDKE